MRLNPLSAPLLDPQGRPFALLTQLRDLQVAGRIKEWPVQVPFGEQRIAGRVCAVRKSETAIERLQRRITRKQQRHKAAVTPGARQYACYVLVFTSLPRQVAGRRQVLECYRLRWQIELTFKRFKSIVQLGNGPKHDDASTRAWLYGKLLVALLAEKLMRLGSAISPWGYYFPANPPIRSRLREFQFGVHRVVEAMFLASACTLP